MLEEEKTIVPNEMTEESGRLNIERGTNFGRYIILKPIGKGGMGEVYAAYDGSLERKVAIKILRADAPGKSTTTRQKRLLREAQAMAKLSNPNVNAVHDVGLFQDRIFVAMEYVDGWTIRQWLREKQPAWKEVVSVFMQAGRGIMAAHESGLVHRDIKPDNILIGRDGRVRVTDFGLVCEIAEPDHEEPSTVDMVVPDEYCDKNTQPLTRTGALLGSPPYMAPEQHRGFVADAKSDQFSFAITLYEALYRKRPFEGHSSAELAEAMIHGRIQTPPHSKVPNWLRSIIIRGLSVDPKNRYPSMKALLAALGKNPTKTKIRWLIWAGVVLFALALEWGVLQRMDQDALCKGTDRHLAGVWDKNIKSQARLAFHKTNLPYAKQAWRQVAHAIDQYTKTWADDHQITCEATHLHGEQSTELLDLRMRCLNRRLGEVCELAGLLALADRQIVEQAVQAAYKLTPLFVCSDIDSLTAPIPLPQDPDLQKSIREVESILAKAKAHADAGKYKDATQWAEEAVTKAQSIAHQPILAEALYLLASVYNETGQFEKSKQTTQKAIIEAIAGKHDTLAAQAWNQMVYIVGYQQADYDEGLMWAGFAQAAVKRIGNPTIKAELLNYKGHIFDKQGKPHKAYEVYQKSLKLRLKAFGPVHPDVASSLNSLGFVLNKLGRYQESVDYYESALSIWEKAYGPRHKITGKLINNLGNVLHRRGLQNEAIEKHLHAISIWNDIFEPEHPCFSWAYNNLGIAYHALQQYKKALSHLMRALTIKQKAYGKQHPILITTLINLGETRTKIGDYKKARVDFKDAQSIIKNKLNDDDSSMGFLHRGICKMLHRQHRFQQALIECKRSLTRMEKAYGTEHPELAITLLSLGLVELNLGHIQRAENVLRRALTLGEKTHLVPLELAPIRFALAQAIWPHNQERKWALELARNAELAYQKAPDSFNNQKSNVRRWLAKLSGKTK